mmetsp:Transcript_12493/g.19325  ORF Transcript_12493/g.19325 Transcript_12493/m.19325 type:complete len:418 (+) Transcript_12493:67-1320(+)
MAMKTLGNPTIPFQSSHHEDVADTESLQRVYSLGSAVPVRPPPIPKGETIPSSSQSSSSSNATSTRVSENEVLTMFKQGFSLGLIKLMAEIEENFPLRIWVVDNSGSMARDDGRRIVSTSGERNDVKIVRSTRWAELQETACYHANMSALLSAPTEFRLLNNPGSRNGPQRFSVAQRGKTYIEQDIEIVNTTMNKTRPAGVTPLALHIRDIRKHIAALTTALEFADAKVAVVIATDGLPTDYGGTCNEKSKLEFIKALRSLQELPVWVVIRLCTNERDVVKFYNDIDSELELGLEVLSNFVDEAKEINLSNKWVNYALPLHRCREFGMQHRAFDYLDERKLTIDEMREFCAFLFGNKSIELLPDVHADWKGFMAGLSDVMEKESPQWNPITRKVEPWINLKRLNRSYGNRWGLKKST